MNIGIRIQKRRIEKKLTQYELAKLLNISRDNLLEIENGHQIPDLDIVILLSDMLDTTTDYLLKGNNSITKDKLAIFSRILYVLSMFFIIAGLFGTYISWNSLEPASAIFSGVLIQLIGITSYYIGKTISNAKAVKSIIYINIGVFMFMPISLLNSYLFSKLTRPYPSSILSGVLTLMIYIVPILIIYINKLKKKSY